MRNQLRSRSGFTMVEIVTVLAIMALLAAVVVPQILQRIGEGKGAALARTLSAVSDAAIEYRADVRRYPTHLRFLSTAPTAGTKDLCNQTVPTTFLAAWGGPYVKTPFTTSGVPVGDATVRDSLELDPVGPYTTSTNGSLVVVALNVDSTVAVQLEKAFDGNSTFGSGTIRFTPGLAKTGTLKFAIPVRGC
jgi:prepilin-type N-terminal cleavage/methylation domain-containing protein